MHVLIVGGGIGGLTLAVALAQKGHVPRVLERARANAIVMRARRFGQIAQWRHTIAVLARNAIMRLTPRSAAERQVRDLWRV